MASYTIEQHWVSFRTLVVKEVRRFLRIWQQTLLPPVITMVLYFLIFGKLIGGRIGEMSGFSYMEFIVPGLVMMSVITNSYANVASSFFSLKFQKSIEELIVSPTPNWIVALGFMMGGVLRAMMTGTIVLLVSLFFVDLSVKHVVLVLLVMFMVAWLFSCAGFINAIFAKRFDDISIIPTFVLTPLTYLGGVFYSITLLPDFWQWISQANPVLYMVNAMRYAVLGESDVSISFSILMLFIFDVAIFIAALWLLARGKHRDI